MDKQENNDDYGVGISKATFLGRNEPPTRLDGQG